MDAIALVDGALPEPVLVFGSAPPEARDLDLLVQGSAAHVVDALAAAGLARKGDELALFRNCTALGVEVLPSSNWGLPAEAVAALFAEAEPLPGCRNLLRPAPHHALLVLGLRLARGYGRIGEQHRRRAQALPAHAWARARADAAAWGVVAQLDVLAGAGPLGRRLPRRPRRGHVVALSGVDGSGKSSQARALVEALQRLGYDAVTAWTPLGSNRSLELLSSAVRRSLRLAHVRRASAATEGGASIVATVATIGGEPLGLAGPLAFAWICLVALLNAFTMVRHSTPHLAAGRLVVYDRYALDSLVRLETLYGRRAARIPGRLIRALAPRPLASFLLSVRGEEAYRRKQDQWSAVQLDEQAERYRALAPELCVSVLDGERPREELCAEIAEAVWRRLP